MLKVLASILLTGLLLSACKKNTFITGNANLGTSVDTLHFDTVFTTTGSVTQFLRIYNQNDQKLRLSNISLSGGTASAFRINVDGTPGPSVKNIEVEANDSLYVFVSVSIDPTSANLPFVIRDSIRIEYNGRDRWVQLDAWGQNAHFFRSKVIKSDETWTNDKPYVILGGLQVDTNVTLTIEKGCRIYAHADAPILVDGTLRVNGEKSESDRVIFRGDRLDNPYRDYPAAWPGIFFRGVSKNNVLQYAVIENAYQGIVAEQPSVNANPKLVLSRTIVDNCYDAGIIGVHSSIRADNCLISNCGKNIMLVYGGQYDLTNCTAAAYSNSYIQHKEPVMTVSDFVRQGNNQYTAALDASFRNCIFWAPNGLADNEVVTQKQGNAGFNVSFQNCLWRVKNDPANITQSNTIANQDPLFESIDTQKQLYNFRLKSNSPAINKGIATSFTLDLDGNPRNNGLPDLGCYEKQ